MKDKNVNKKYIIYGVIIAILLIAVVYVNFVMGSGSDSSSDGGTQVEVVQNKDTPTGEEPTTPSTPEQPSNEQPETPSDSDTEPNPGANEKIANRFPGAGRIANIGRNPFQDPPQPENTDPNNPLPTP